MKRKIIIIAIAIAIIVGGALLVLWAINRSPKLQNVVLRLANTSTTNTAPTNTPTNVPVVIVAPDKQAIQFAARNFTERFGSGSNQNAGSNLIEAQAYGTTLFNNYLTAQAKQQQTAPIDPVYHGTITKALVFTFLKQTTNAASVVVSTQQTVTTGQQSQVLTKDIQIELAKVGSDWKVSGAFWK